MAGTAKAIWKYPPVVEMLSALEAAEPFPEGTEWTMAFFKKNLGDLDTLYRFGVPGGHPAVRQACERWLDVAFFPHPECYPMQLVAGLVRYADREDPRLQERIRYVMANEPFFNGNRPGVLRYGSRRGGCCGSHSCHMSAAKAMWAAIGVPSDERSPELRDYIHRGARYLALHRLYQSSRRPGRPIEKQYADLHVPVALTCETDILDLLDIATQAGLERDESIADALELLLSKQNERGRWCVEARGRWVPDRRRLAGYVATLEAVGEESKWITLGALLVLRRCAEFIAGGERTELAEEGPLDDGDVLAHYPFVDDPADESRVRGEWESIGMGPALEQLLSIDRDRDLRTGWHWGYVMGPDSCPEWCAAKARWVPRRGFSKSWPICRIHFLSRRRQFSAEGLSETLGIPLVDEHEKASLKKVFWNSLWRIRVKKWRDDYDEVAVTIRDPRELTRLVPVMDAALAELPRRADEVHTAEIHRRRVWPEG